ncbi:hypothetical protein [Streptomyces litchfieldiae]|uniref:Uncharacterized protein n=1 Tax=Streptomyces litchfieldiae TaxID=3075543 RepID=A0ABU2N0R9_9ACTN|nr:hypothetical protein [Streptomyces sp. DSM 44938]MDT0347475.1 hypothetical protein [Streptomyces sp. DSM 44938]
MSPFFCLVVGRQARSPGGAAAFEALHTAPPDLTAVFTFRDLVAIGALRAARWLRATPRPNCHPRSGTGAREGDAMPLVVAASE